MRLDHLLSRETRHNVIYDGCVYSKVNYRWDSRARYLIVEVPRRIGAYSSVGQSARLISVRSVVQIHLGPPTNILVFSGDIAQLGERSLCKAEVTGSIPVISTKDTRKPGDASPRCSLTTEYGIREPIWIGLFPYGLSGYAAILHSRSRSGSCLKVRFQPEKGSGGLYRLPCCRAH